MYKSIGSRIKERRQELGMTQSQLAEKISDKETIVNKAYICTLEKDKFNLSFNRMLKIAKILDVDIAYFS